MKSLIIKFVLTNYLFMSLVACTPPDDECYETIKEIKVEYTEIERESVDLINAYRLSQGKSTLQMFDPASNVAGTHTDYMIGQSKTSHDNFPDRYSILSENYGAKSVGENVGYGYNSADGVVSAYLNSESHLHIIEKSQYTHIGVSVKPCSKGRNYFTHIFITK